MQLAIIEYAQNVLGFKDATSREIDPSSKKIVIDIMESQKENIKNGKMKLKDIHHLDYSHLK